MDKDWAERLRDFDRVWKRVSQNRSGQRNACCQKMPQKTQNSRNSRFHGGRR